jgi:hypothetical protein
MHSIISTQYARCTNGFRKIDAREEDAKMAPDAFISYANEDRVVADAACASLEGRGIRCWIAPRDVSPGMYYAQAIIRAIKESRVMVLVFSSSANRSHHVVREAEQAVRAGIPIIPFRIDATSPDEMLNYYVGPQHWLDATSPPIEAHFERLGEAVELLLTTAATAAPSPPSSVPGEAPAPAPTTLSDSGESPDVRKSFPGAPVPHTRIGPFRLRRPRSRVVAAAFAAVIAAVILAAGFAFLGPTNPFRPSATPQPSASAGPNYVRGAGTLVLTPSDFVSPNSTLTKADNITIKLDPGGTFVKTDKTGNITGTYELATPDSTRTSYTLWLTPPNPYSVLALPSLQSNGDFTWTVRDLNATKGYTDLYAGQYTWSTPFKQT